jgi:hypothetical protein
MLQKGKSFGSEKVFVIRKDKLEKNRIEENALTFLFFLHLISNNIEKVF